MSNPMRDADENIRNVGNDMSGRGKGAEQTTSKEPEVELEDTESINISPTNS